jgi:hypothetical protein
MDDFRVGSVPPSSPYGDRHPSDAVARRRHRHHDDEHSGQQDGDTTDTFEASSDDREPADTPDEEIRDFYRPSGTEPETS